MADIENWIQRITILRIALIWFKRVSLPGFDGVPIYDVAVFFYNEITRFDIDLRAKAIAFSFFLAIFPAIIFLFTLLPYIPVENLQGNLLGLLSNILPENAYELIYQTVNDILSIQRGGLLSVGFVLALYFSTNGVVGMMQSFDKTYGIFIHRSFLVVRLVALKLTLILSLLLIGSIVMIVAGGSLFELLFEKLSVTGFWSRLLINILTWTVIVLLFFNAISLIYYYGPAVKKKFRFISAGSTLATLLMLLISIGFSYYVNSFGSYNKLYGSIGTILALMLWMYLNAFILLIGFELNASIAVNKDLQSNKIIPDTQANPILSEQKEPAHVRHLADSSGLDE